MAQEQTLGSNAESGRRVVSLSFPASRLALAKSSKGELAKDIAYLSQLYSSGEISEKAFENLVEKACQLFVEVEVERRLSAYLEHKIIRLLHKLTSELGDSDLTLLGANGEDDWV